MTFNKIEKLGNINLDSSVSLFAIDLNVNYKLNALKELARTVYCQPERAVFTPETAGRLDLIVAILSNYPNAKFHIEGHTDNSGTEYFNQILSDDRANAVRNYLIANGIKADNLTAKGYGGSMPIDANTTESGKAMNRRVEIKLEQ